MRLFVVFFSLLFFMSSCQQQQEVLAPQQEEQAATQEEKDLIWGLEQMNQDEILILWNTADGMKWDVEQNRDTEQVVFRTHDCEGSGISFIKCVKGLLDDGYEVHLGSDGHGNYWADKM